MLVPFHSGGRGTGGGAVSVSFGARAVASRSLLVASILTQLEDQLTGVVRDHGVVVFQDDAFQLQSPFPLLFQIPGLFDLKERREEEEEKKRNKTQINDRLDSK